MQRVFGAIPPHISIFIVAKVMSVTQHSMSVLGTKCLLPEAVCCCLQTCNCGFNE